MNNRTKPSPKTTRKRPPSVRGQKDPRWGLLNLRVKGRTEFSVRKPKGQNRVDSAADHERGTTILPGAAESDHLRLEQGGRMEDSGGPNLKMSRKNPSNKWGAKGKGKGIMSPRPRGGKKEKGESLV